MSKELDVMEIGELTMSSREIAEFLGVRHNDLTRSIERLIDSEVIKGYAPVAYTHPQNKQVYNEYIFKGPSGKRDSIVVMAQNSPQLTGRLVDRWLELEASLNEEKLRIAARERARLDAPKMTLALKTSLEDAGKQPKWYHFANEHSMLYRAAFGKTCKELLDEIGEDANLRDHLTFNQISLLEDLQRADEFFIESGMDYHERKLRIEKMVSKRALHLIQEEKV